jgi:site-specific recombinase XerC
MNSQARAWVDGFHRYLQTERRVSPHTSSAYALDLAALVAFCDRSGLNDWSEVKPTDVRTFAAKSYAGGLSPLSVRRRLSAVRTFMRFLIRCTISRNGPARFRMNGPTLHGLPAEPRFESSTRPFSLRQVFWL